MELVLDRVSKQYGNKIAVDRMSHFLICEAMSSGKKYWKKALTLPLGQKIH